MTAAPYSWTVAVALDRSYVAPAMATLRSIAASNPGVHVHVVHEGLPDADVARLRDAAAGCGTVDVVEATWDFGAFPTSDRVSSATYFRLQVPHLCSAFERVVYIDCDALVLDSLVPLVATPLGSSPVAAVQDPINPTLGGGEALRGFEAPDLLAPYFNAGVMVIDTAAWVRADVSGRALRFLRTRPECITYWDQDALNAVLVDDWVPLDAVWNVLPIRDIRRVFGDPPQYRHIKVSRRVEHAAKVMHFATDAKPWLDVFPRGRSLRTFRRFSRPEDFTR